MDNAIWEIPGYPSPYEGHLANPDRCGYWWVQRTLVPLDSRNMKVILSSSLAIVLATIPQGCSNRTTPDAHIDVLGVDDDGVLPDTLDDTMLDQPPDGLDGVDVGEHWDLDGGDLATDPVAELEGVVDPILVLPGHTPTDCGLDCRQVTFAEDPMWSEFDVWDRYLVYNTWDTSGEDTIKDIFYVDLFTSNTYLINETNLGDEGKPGTGYVTLYNNRIAFSFRLFNPYQHFWLLSFSISEANQNILWSLSSYSSGFDDLQMYENTIAWWDNRTGETGDGWFYFFDITTGIETLISIEPCFVCGNHGVDIWGNHVVFHGDNGGSDWIHLFVHDIDSGITEMMTPGYWDHYMPSIWGNIVVWTDTRNGGSAGTQTMADVYMMDLDTGEESVVCDNPASQPAATAIWGNRIAWKDLRNDPIYQNDPAAATIIDVYMLDLLSGLETRVDLPAGRKDTIKIHEDKLYFQMVDDAGFTNVFEKTLY